MSCGDPSNFQPSRTSDWLAGKSFGAVEAPAYGIIDPDYARVYTQARIIAWQYGFACVMHGSFTRDLDLLLVPWEDRAYDKIVVPILKQIAASCDLQLNVDKDGVPTASDKPHGRKAYTLHFPGFHDRRWVDISVMPCVPKESAP
jgi:hypothetical protein